MAYWMMLSANLVTMSRAKLHHELGYTAASPVPLEGKANNT